MQDPAREGLTIRVAGFEFYRLGNMIQGSGIVPSVHRDLGAYEMHLWQFLV